MIPVETVMNRDTVILPKTFTAREAARLMGSCQIGSLLVTRTTATMST